MLRTRLAPTPSGYLHMGNAASFLLTWRLARRAGGHLLLRIDDIDKSRCRRPYLDDIFDTLHWLGIDYDAGPRSTPDFLQHWSQHHRLAHYTQALQQLREGGHLYACTCSRQHWQLHATDHRYPGLCRTKNIPLDTPAAAWRLRVPTTHPIAMQQYQAPPHLLDVGTLMGDFVVRTKSGLPAYQLVSLIDDLHFACNTIIRGADLLPSTAAQLYLAECLQQPAFLHATFLHHPLLTDATGHKLSKSEGAAALLTWRTTARSPHLIHDWAAKAFAMWW